MKVWPVALAVMFALNVSPAIGGTVSCDDRMNSVNILLDRVTVRITDQESRLDGLKSLMTKLNKAQSDIASADDGYALAVIADNLYKYSRTTEYLIDLKVDSHTAMIQQVSVERKGLGTFTNTHFKIMETMLAEKKHLLERKQEVLSSYDCFPPELREFLKNSEP